MTSSSPASSMAMLQNMADKKPPGDSCLALLTSDRHAAAHEAPENSGSRPRGREVRRFPSAEPEVRASLSRRQLLQSLALVALASPQPAWAERASRPPSMLLRGQPLQGEDWELTLDLAEFEAGALHLRATFANQGDRVLLWRQSELRARLPDGTVLRPHRPPPRPLMIAPGTSAPLDCSLRGGGSLTDEISVLLQGLLEGYGSWFDVADQLLPLAAPPAAGDVEDAPEDRPRLQIVGARPRGGAWLISIGIEQRMPGHLVRISPEQFSARTASKTASLRPAARGTVYLQEGASTVLDLLATTSEDIATLTCVVPPGALQARPVRSVGTFTWPLRGGS